MACCPPNFATFHLCGSKRETLKELLVCPPLWPEFAQYPHLWEWGDGRTLGEGSRSAGSPTLCCTSPGARPLAHSWLLRWPYPPRFWTGCILGSKDLCFHQPLPAAPHPAPGLVTDSILVASVLICLPGPWVGGRSWQLDCVPSLEPPPPFVITPCFSADRFLSLPCSLSIYLYSSVSPCSAGSRFWLLPPPQLSPLGCSSSLPLSLTSPWRVGRGEGADRALVPPTSVWAGASLLWEQGEARPPEPSPRGPTAQQPAHPSPHLEWVCSRAGGQVLLSAP